MLARVVDVYLSPAAILHEERAAVALEEAALLNSRVGPLGDADSHAFVLVDVAV